MFWVYLMVFLLKYQNDVSWFNTWCLVSFPRECDLLAVLHAFVHMNFQKFCLLANLLTLALSAAVLLIYHLAWTKIHTHTLKKKVWLWFSIDIIYLCRDWDVCLCWSVTLSVAVGADRLHLLHHPWGQLSDHDFHSSSSACHTLLYCSCLTPLTTSQKVQISNIIISIPHITHF